MSTQVNPGVTRMNGPTRRKPRTAVMLGLMVLAAGSAAAQAEFAYFGSAGPAFWGRLDPAWEACGQRARAVSGRFRQATLLTALHRQPVPVEYERSTGEIFNNGHTIEIETEGHNVLMLGGVEYELQQFHFHVSSEHTFAGKGSDMELHLVHKSAAGDTAVVGVLLVARSVERGAGADLRRAARRRRGASSLACSVQPRQVSAGQSRALPIRRITHDAPLHRRRALARAQGSDHRIQRRPGTVPRANPLQRAAGAAVLPLASPHGTGRRSRR